MTASFLIGLGTALPTYELEQSELGRVLCEYLQLDGRSERLLHRVLGNPAVRTRYSVLPDFSHRSGAALYGATSPALEDRMNVYRQEAPRLAARAGAIALRQAGVDVEELSQLIVVSSTAAYTPGPDAAIAHELGVPPTTERAFLSMMGCSGAFHGLHLARNMIHSGPVLVVCVELSSIHLGIPRDDGHLVAHALFGDGAAAMVLGSASDHSLLEFGTSRTFVDHEARDVVRWDLTERGFVTVLGRELPNVLRKHIRRFVEPLALEAGFAQPGDVPSWALHPGGANVIRVLADELSANSVISSREVLSEIGNVSSCSVLFSLQRELQRHGGGIPGIMAGFGPGLTLSAVGYTTRPGSEAATRHFPPSSIP